MLNGFLPASISPLERARAKVVSSTCLGTSVALLLLVLYWIVGALTAIWTNSVSAMIANKQ